MSRIWTYLTPVWDIMVSAILLTVLMPLVMACALAVRVSSCGPIFFSQRRLGLGGKVFGLFKFRTMYVGASDVRNRDGSTFSSNNDPRVTQVGRFLRKMSLDELPQLLNV